MTYDFTRLLEREGRDCIAADRCPIPDAQLRPGFTSLCGWPI